jgi:hypothetical protein
MSAAQRYTSTAATGPRFIVTTLGLTLPGGQRSDVELSVSRADPRPAASTAWRRPGRRR